MGCCFARLGETEQQVTNRYGAVVQAKVDDAGRRVLTFKFQRYWVQVTLRDGKSVVEYVAVRMKGEPFLEPDALAVAGMVSGTTNWVLRDAGAFSRFWVSNPSRFFASFSNEPGAVQSILVSTVAESAIATPPRAPSGF